MAKIFIDESKKSIRNLRNNNSNMIERSKQNHTFHENAEKVFNKLPLSIREKNILQHDKKVFH